MNKNCIYYTPWETAAARGFLRPKQVRFIRPGFFKRDAAQYSFVLPTVDTYVADDREHFSYRKMGRSLLFCSRNAAHLKQAPQLLRLISLICVLKGHDTEEKRQ